MGALFRYILLSVVLIGRQLLPAKKASEGIAESSFASAPMRAVDFVAASIELTGGSEKAPSHQAGESAVCDVAPWGIMTPTTSYKEGTLAGNQEQDTGL